MWSIHSLASGESVAGFSLLRNAALGRRFTSTLKRTVPYITKGAWKLPSSPDTTIEKGIEEISPNKNTHTSPKNWRKLKSLPPWKKQMFALKEKFPEGWQPNRKLSREDMEAVRAAKRLRPQLTTSDLGNEFRISPEAVRRILKSKWQPRDAQEKAKVEQRWKRRGQRLGAVSDETKQKIDTKRRQKLTAGTDFSNTIL